MRLKTGILLLIINACFFVLNVSAHQQKAAITKILFNQRSGNLEVMHRFILHDAEHAVHHLFGKDANIIADVDTQETFSQYVTKHFKLANLNKATLPLEYVGYSIEGQYIWVYQEIKTPKELSGLVVSHSALIDLWTEQINTVNIEGQGDIKTLIFSGGNREYRVDF